MQVSTRAIQGAIKLLADHRFIEIVKVGNLCIYRVNTRVTWQGNRGERFAHFAADVIAFENEQNGKIGDLAPLKQMPVLETGERVLVGNEPIAPLIN